MRVNAIAEGTDARVAAPTLVLIASAGHSGSTLLDLLIANHSQVCSAGEMNRLTLHAADRVCACGATVTSCAYWNSVRAVITRRRNAASMIKWQDCHTDLPPDAPVARIDGSVAHLLAEDVQAPARLRQRLADAGVTVSERAILRRAGVRDFKWRVDDPATQQTYVLRSDGSGTEIYSAAAPAGKNPLRLMPEPLELALALGAAPVLRLLQGCSSKASRYAAIAANSWAVAEAMAMVSGSRFVVDSSKSPVRLKLLYMTRPSRVRVVHLVRDGRAVTASAMRRRQMSASTAARIWQRDNRNLAVMLKTIPKRFITKVRYERLCEDPAGELKRVCEFLDIEFENGMVGLWGRPVHNIPGNPMLFDRQVRAIRRDDKWRRDLAEKDMQAFERAAGRLNRSFGYV
jgi:hypothetical protein